MLLDVILRRENSEAKCFNCEYWVGIGEASIKGKCTKHDMTTLDLNLCSAWEQAANSPVQIKSGATSDG